MTTGLVELFSDLSDVSGNNHKVAMGESNEKVSITIPGSDRRGEPILLAFTHSHSSAFVYAEVSGCSLTSCMTRCLHNDIGRSVQFGCRGHGH